MSSLFQPGFIGPQSLWSPLQLRPYAWYDAYLSPKTLIGDKVSQWNDISGTDLHLTQGADTQRPTYSASDEWVEFDGVDDFMTPSGPFLPAGNTPITAFIVAEWTSGAIQKHFISQGTGSNHKSIQIGTSFAAPANRYSVDIYGSELIATGLTPSESLMSFSYVAGNRQIFRNGSRLANDTYYQMELAEANPRVGRANDTTGRQAWAGRIRTLIVLRDDLTPFQRQLVEGYLAWRFDLVSLLPNDHPFKTSAPRRDAGQDEIIATDFSETAAGAHPAGWNMQWGTTGLTVNVGNSPGAISGKAMQWRQTAEGSNAVSWSPAGVFENGEVLFRFCKREPIDDGYDIINAMARGTGTSVPTSNGLRGGASVNSLLGDAFAASSIRFVNGSGTAFFSVALGSAGIGEWIWARFRVNGGNQFIRVWKSGLPEPPEWPLVTYFSSVPPPGWVGLHRGAAPYDVDIDYFAVAKNGVTIPLPEH